jgi:putative ABC transport system permease protein
MVLALDMRSFGETVTARPVAGESSSMYRVAAAGEGVLVSDNFAQLKGLRLGDALELAAPYGLIRLPIVGVVVDYSDQQGTIMMDRAVFIRYWHDDSVNVLRVFTAPGESPMAVRQRILERFAGTRQMFVMTNAEAQAYIMKVIGQWSSMTSIQTAVALLVAVLGIVNALTVSITDRRRELGVLRAVGALHWQVRRTIWMEAVAIGAFGLVLGLAFGALNLTYLLDVVHRDVAGMRLIYEFPFGAALLVAPVVLGAAFLGALWPAELAVRGSVVEALVHE